MVPETFWSRENRECGEDDSGDLVNHLTRRDGDMIEQVSLRWTTRRICTVILRNGIGFAEWTLSNTAIKKEYIMNQKRNLPRQNPFDR
jgi:hypothetical protein